MSSQPLQRTEYWNVATSPPTLIIGPTGHGETVRDVEDYLLPLARITASALHGWGVAEGLGVSGTSGAQGLTIAAGTALDGAGRIIALAVGGSAVIDPQLDPAQIQGVVTVPVTAAGVVLPTTGRSGDQILTVTWLEVLDQDLSTLVHAPWLRLVPAAGFADDGSVVALAAVTLDPSGAVTVLSAGAAAARAPSTSTGAVRLARPSSAGTSGLSAGQSPAGELAAVDGGGVLLSVTDADGALQLAAGSGPDAGLLAVGARLSLRASSDPAGTERVRLDATDASITADRLHIGAVPTAPVLRVGAAAGALAVSATRVGIDDSTGTERISLDATTATIGAAALAVGPTATVTAGSSGALVVGASQGAARLGVGTQAPRNPLGVRALGTAEELVSFEDVQGATRWHINQKLGGVSALNFVETGVADGRLFLQAGGKVGIGTTNPAFTLDVNGTVCAAQFCNPSDMRLKQEVAPLHGVLERLAGVRPVSFRRHAAEHRQVGVLAQEVQEAFPELVVEIAGEAMKAVDYAGLAGVLLGAVQELTVRVARLEHAMGQAS
jgi:hypothetical protein